MLYFDTETSGLPFYGDFDSARLVQLAYIIVDDRNEIKKTYSCYVKNDSFKSSAEAFKIHNISDEFRNNYGTPTADVLAEFMEDAKQVKAIISHGIAFDVNVICNELRKLDRAEDVAQLVKIKQYDTKQTYVYQMLRYRNGFTTLLNTVKYITKLNEEELSEMIKTEYHIEKSEAHDALFDVFLCYLLFNYDAGGNLAR